MSPVLADERPKKSMGNGQTDKHTDRQTDGHRDSMTDLAQRAKSVKIRHLGDTAMNFSKFADSSTDTKTEKKRRRTETKKKIRRKQCLVSGVLCRIWRVTCHLSLTPTATDLREILVGLVTCVAPGH